MTRGKLIAAKVVVGILCVFVITGTTITGGLLYGFATHNDKMAGLYTHYDNLPNIMGENGVYVSKNFFVENNFEIPKYVVFSCEHGHIYGDKVRTDFGYTSRGKDLAYHCKSSRLESQEQEGISVDFSCSPYGIQKLKNKKKYNEFTYSLTTNEQTSKNDNKVMITSYSYVINFNRNENTSKKCQLTMSIRIEHNKDIPSEQYAEFCDKLFYSMLDNVVYRNI